MIAIIQALVIIVALGLTLFVFIGKQTHAARAWKKMALVVLAVVMIVAVLFPQTTDVIAHVFGIGRGADLVLYLLTLAFITYAINGYIHQQQNKVTIHKLARRLALSEANQQEIPIRKKATQSRSKRSSSTR
jgi:small membrane protein